MLARLIFAIFSFAWTTFLGAATVFAGTGDLGGGANGINGRPLDAYIKDPRTLPAYVQYLKPIFDHIEAEEIADLVSSGLPVNEDHTKFSDYMMIKTWYFVPKELTGINQDALGISFGADGTQQIAHHKERAIWINTLIFDRMTPADQAMTLLHEFVMTIYFMKFKTFGQVCDLTRLVEPHSTTCAAGNSRVMRLMDQLYPVVPIRPLNADDYERIRPMTNWLMQNGATFSIADIWAMFKAYDFDRRFFNLYSSPTNSKYKITKTEVLAAFSRAKYGRRMPTHCLSIEGTSLGECSVEVKETRLASTAAASKATGLEFSVRNGASTALTTPVFLAESSDISPITDFMSGNSLYLLFLVAAIKTDDAQAGQVLHHVAVYLRKSGSAGHPIFEIDSIAIKPVVLTEVNPTETEDARRCVGEDLEEDSLAERSFVMVSSKSQVGLIHKLLLLSLPPFTYCVK